MKHLFQTLTILIFCVFRCWTQEDSSCSELLKHGIYDKYSSTSSTSGYSKFLTDFCSKYSQSERSQADSTSGASSNSESTSHNSKERSGGAGASLNIFGLFDFGGDASWSSSDSAGGSSKDSSSNSQISSSDQISNLGKLLCSDTSSTEIASNVVNQSSEFIDPNAMDAYKECLTLNADGLKVKTTVRGDQAQVTLEIRYVAPPGAPAKTEVSSIEISPAGSWKCTGSLWNLRQEKGNGRFGTGTVAMSCERNVSSSPFTYLNQSLYAGSSSIIVSTLSGTVIRNFVPIYANPQEDAITLLANRIADFQAEVEGINSKFQEKLDILEKKIIETGSFNYWWDWPTLFPGSFPEDHLNSDGNFWRDNIHRVTFNKKFTSIPQVIVNLSLLDMNAGKPRLYVHAGYVGLDGFDVVVTTWGDTKVAGYGVMWLAYQE